MKRNKQYIINKIYINGPIDYVIGVKEHLLALNNNLEIEV